MRQHLRGVRVHLALVHDRHAKHAPERLSAKQEVPATSTVSQSDRS